MWDKTRVGGYLHPAVAYSIMYNQVINPQENPRACSG